MSTTHSANQPIDRTQSTASGRAVQASVDSKAYIYQLIAKEARQLAPLVLALVGCGLFLDFLGLISFRLDQNSFYSCILVLIPTLFAVGAGPMLVSQEKEQRTLGWIGSLPVPWRAIVLSKLFVSLLALAVVWLVSFGLTAAFHPPAVVSTSLDDLGWMFWFGNTFFLLVIVFALTWLFPSALSALVAALFVFSGVAIVSSFEQLIYSEHSGEGPSFEIWLLVNYFILLGIVGWLAIRSGSRSWVAYASSPSIFASWRSLDWRYRNNDRPQKQTQSPASSLIWQIGIQNRMVWLSFGLIVLMSIGWLCYALDYLQSPDLLGFTGAIGCLILIWLGVSVFGSDANRQRIQFLAERGIAPGLVWWTRLILPIGLVAIGLIVFLSAHQAWHSQQNPYQQPSHPMASIPWPTTIFGVMVIFTFTQWFSQWTRSTLIVFCLAPAIAIFAVGYGMFAKEFLDASWWLLLASIGIGFVATRIMLCPWMDGRFGLRYYLSHGAMLFVALAIPSIPFLITFTTYPAMPSSLRQALELEAEGYGKNIETIELVPKENDEGNPTGETTAESNNFSHSIDQILVSLEDELSHVAGGIRPTYRLFQFVVDTANLAVLQLESQETNEVAQVRYRRCLLLLGMLAERLRLSEYLLAQEYADRIESWLVRELEKPDRRLILGSANIRRIAKTLSDTQSRHKARRRSIVVGWKEAAYGKDANSFGGMTLPNAGPTSSVTTWLVAERDLGLATAELLKYLDQNDLVSSDLPIELTQYWNSVYARNLPADSGQLNLDSIWIPGKMWHLDWEDRAQRLFESMQ